MLDLIHAYETYLTKVKQASANTVCSYMRDIRQFTEWLQESEHTDILDATQLNISDYLRMPVAYMTSSMALSRSPLASTPEGCASRSSTSLPVRICGSFFSPLST